MRSRSTKQADQDDAALVPRQVGVFTIPLFILWLVKRDIFMQAGLCNVVLLTCLFVSVASQLNVLAVTAERYAAVCHPFLHRRLLLSKPELVRWVISAVWFSSAAGTGFSSLAVAPDPSRCSYHSHFRSSFLLATVVLGIVVPFATISALNLRMLVKVRLSRLFGEEMGRPAAKAQAGPHHRCRHHRSTGKLSKASAMVVIVCSLFLMAWTPFLVMVVIYALCPACPLSQALDLILLFTFSNSACNPVVYAHCNRTFRHAYKQILTGCCLPSSKAISVMAQKGSMFFPVGGNLPAGAANG